MKILLVDDEQDILEILMFTLDAELEADLITAKSGNEAIEVIKSVPDVDLIICDYNMNNGNGGDVYKYLLDNEIRIPYAMCSSDSPEDHNIFNDKRYFIGNILKPGVFDGIETILERYEEFSQKMASGHSVELSRISSEFTFINLNLLKSFKQLPSDVFIKVGDEKMLKVFAKNAEITIDEIHKYKNKSLDKLMVRKSDVKLFVDYVCQQIDSILKNKGNISEEEKILNVHSVILDTVRTIGISDQIVRASEKSVAFAVNVFKENKEFRVFSKHIFGHKGDFLTKHSVALAYISCGILTKLPWDSYENRNKLALASFFHDATIKDTSFNENVIDEKINSISNFNEHPIEAAELVKKFKGIPPDVDKIISEHHERPDGSGFPKKLVASQISPLGSIFIVAHAIVECIFKQTFEKNELKHESILSCVQSQFEEVSNFKKVIDAFKNTNFFD